MKAYSKPRKLTRAQLAGLVHISAGNSKLGAIPSISLRAGLDCADWVPCRSQCYACRLMKVRPSMRATWERNSTIARKDPKSYFLQVRLWLQLPIRPNWFRWHIGGDILNQVYLEEMKKVALEYPQTRFLCFTKRHDLKFGDLPDNLVIVFSMWPGWGNVAKARNLRLPIAWQQDGTEKRVPADAIPCPGSCENCAMCWHLRQLNRDVVFQKH